MTVIIAAALDSETTTIIALMGAAGTLLGVLLTKLAPILRDYWRVRQRTGKGREAMIEALENGSAETVERLLNMIIARQDREIDQLRKDHDRCSAEMTELRVRIALLEAQVGKSAAKQAAAAG